MIGTTAITARYSGAPLRVIASTLARPFQWLYARPEIEQLDQLKGTTVSTTLFGGASTFFLTKVLKENFRWKDPERELRWLSTPTPFMTLLNRSANAASLSGEEKQQADRSGMRMILDVGKYIQAAYGGTVVTESTLKNRQLLAERFLRALLKGLWFIQDPGKKEETVRILAKWLKAERFLDQRRSGDGQSNGVEPRNEQDGFEVSQARTDVFGHVRVCAHEKSERTVGIQRVAALAARFLDLLSEENPRAKVPNQECFVIWTTVATFDNLFSGQASTSATQLYRLLDQTNYQKSLDQLVSLLQLLECDVDLVVRKKSA